MVANVTGDIYPTTVEGIRDILVQQVASPVQWVKGLETLYAHGVRTFVEVAPRSALKGFVDDVLGNKPMSGRSSPIIPRSANCASFNQALCGLYAAGYGVAGGRTARGTFAASRGCRRRRPQPPVPHRLRPGQPAASELQPCLSQSTAAPPRRPDPTSPTTLSQSLAQAFHSLRARTPARSAAAPYRPIATRSPLGSVIITGTGLELPAPRSQSWTRTTPCVSCAASSSST